MLGMIKRNFVDRSN